MVLFPTPAERQLAVQAGTPRRVHCTELTITHEKNTNIPSHDRACETRGLPEKERREEKKDSFE